MTPTSLKSTPIIEEVSPPPVSISPHSDYLGQIHLVSASLMQPYFDLSQHAFDNLDKVEIRKCGANLSIQKARDHVQQSKGNRSPPRVALGAGSKPPDRPAIVCPPPVMRSTQSDMDKAYFFLMGTFSGHRPYETPEVLKEFAIPIHTSNLRKEEAEQSIRTTPPWDAKGKRAWVVVIPIATIDGLLPAKRWEGNGATYRLDKENYNKLMARSREILEEFNTQAQNPRVLSHFINALWNRRHENVRREACTRCSSTY